MYEIEIKLKNGKSIKSVKILDSRPNIDEALKLINVDLKTKITKKDYSFLSIKNIH